MTDRPGESPEVAAAALADPALAGWNENTGDPRLPGTFWWVRIGDVYAGVAESGPGAWEWFVSQGRRGNPDLDPEVLGHGTAGSPADGRVAAATWYNAHRRDLGKRP